MKIETLFQYIFDIPVYPSKVLLALYLSPVSTAREICERSGISRGKVYQTIQFLEKEGFVDRSERGIIKPLLYIIKNRSVRKLGSTEILELTQQVHRSRYDADSS